MKAKRLIAVVLAFLLIFGNAFSVNAAGIIGEMITDISGLNRLTVSAALNNYFNSREAFLLNQADTINVPLAGVVEDEATHRAKYASEDIVFVDSSISIGEVSVYETNADAEVTETVTYMKDGIPSTATVPHELFLGLNNDNVPVIISDRYYESFSNFKSCSYVDESVTLDVNAVSGSGSCIVYVAEKELGYEEGANNDNKYGIWYGENNLGWCAAFIAWCANEANIPDSVIKYDDYPPAILAQLNQQNNYYSRSEAVGSNSPSTGDIVFFTEDNTSASHVGIVRWSDASYIYVVHGNYSDCVCFTTFSRCDSYILGYGKPAYINTGHTYYTDITEDFYYDSTEHWVFCVNCGHECENEPHSITYTMTLTKHKASCSTCEYEETYVDHYSEVYDWDDTKHWKYCDTCNAYFASGTHNLVATNVSWMYVCSECEYETRITRSINEASE